MAVPRRIWYWSVGLAVTRFCAFYVLKPTKIDALWQFAYLPLWIIDFPISIAYFVFSIPIPFGEAVVGTLWWFCIPILAWLFSKRRKNGQRAT